jgi:hypothetical protein
VSEVRGGFHAIQHEISTTTTREFASDRIDDRFRWIERFR